MDESLIAVRLEPLLDFHPAIIYIRLLAPDGTALASVVKKSKSALEPPGQTSLILSRLAIAGGMTSGTENFYGKASAIIIIRERLTELLFLLTRRMVLVGAGADYPMAKTEELAKQVKRMQVDEW